MVSVRGYFLVCWRASGDRAEASGDSAAEVLGCSAPAATAALLLCPGYCGAVGDLIYTGVTFIRHTPKMFIEHYAPGNV